MTLALTLAPFCATTVLALRAQRTALHALCTLALAPHCCIVADPSCLLTAPQTSPIRCVPLPGYDYVCKFG